MRYIARKSVVFVAALILAVVGIWTVLGDGASPVSVAAHGHMAGHDQRLGPDVRHDHAGAHDHGNGSAGDSAGVPSAEGARAAGDCGGNVHDHGPDGGCCDVVCHVVADLPADRSALPPHVRAAGNGPASHAVVTVHLPGLDRPPRTT